MKQYPQRNFSQGVYGDRPEVIQPDAPDKGTLGDGFVQINPDHFTKISDDSLQGVERFANARNRRFEAGIMEETPWYMSAAAGFMLAPTADIYRRLTKPEFEDDPPVDLFQYLEQTPIVFTPEEHEFIREHAKGQNSAKWAVSQVREIRQYRQMASEGPVSAFVGGAFDPVNLLPVARLGNSLLSRAANAALYGGINAGAEVAGLTPKSAEDVALAGLMGAAGGAAFGGKQALKRANAIDPSTEIPTTVNKVREPRIDGDVPFTPDSNEPTITGMDGPSRDLVVRRDYSPATREVTEWEVLDAEAPKAPEYPQLPDNGRRAVHDLPTIEQIEYNGRPDVIYQGDGTIYQKGPEAPLQLGMEHHPPRPDTLPVEPVRVPQTPSDFVPEVRLLGYDVPPARVPLNTLVETTAKTEINRLQRAIASLKALDKRKGLSAQQRRKLTALETKRTRLKEGSKVWSEVQRQFELPDPDIAIRQTVEAMQKAADDPRWAHAQNQRVLREVRRLGDLPEVNQRPSPTVIELGGPSKQPTPAPNTVWETAPAAPAAPVPKLPTVEEVVKATKPKKAKAKKEASPEAPQKPQEAPQAVEEQPEPPTLQEVAATHPEAFDALPEYVKVEELGDAYIPAEDESGMLLVDTGTVALEGDVPMSKAPIRDTWMRSGVDTEVDQYFRSNDIQGRFAAANEFMFGNPARRELIQRAQALVDQFLPSDIKVLLDSDVRPGNQGNVRMDSFSIRVGINKDLDAARAWSVLQHELGHAVVHFGMRQADSPLTTAFEHLILDIQKAARQKGNARAALYSFTASHRAEHRFGSGLARMEQWLDNPDLALADILNELYSGVAGAKRTQKRPSQYYLSPDELGADMFHKYLTEVLSRQANPPSYLRKVADFLAEIYHRLLKVLKFGPPVQRRLDQRAAAFFDGIAKSIERTGKAGSADRSASFSSGTPGSVFHSIDLNQVLQQPTVGVRTNKSAKVAKAMAWNMHKTMASLGDGAKAVADLLYDDPLQGGNRSIEALRQGVLSDLREGQVTFEQKMLDALKKRGAGLVQRIKNSRRAAQIQNELETEVYMEMVARNEAHHMGVPVKHHSTDPDVLGLADQLDKISAQALGELQRAGVKNSKHLKETPGFISRQWDSSKIEHHIRNHGDGANSAIAELLKGAILKRTPLIPDDVALQVAEAIRDRALRKGYFEDSVGAGVPNLVKAKMRDSMKSAGVAEKDITAAMSVFDEVTAVEGGSGYLKSRIGMDMLYEHTMPDGTVLRPVDLVDTNVSSITDTYLKKVATDAGFAQRGLTKPADILKVREHLLREVPEGKRLQMAQQFDDTISYFKGLPQGVRMNDNFRRATAYGRTITLAASGLWQLTEYASIMARYGLGATTAAMLRHAPGVRALFDPANHKELAHVLSQHSSYNVRLRPFLKKFEDGHSMEALSGADLKLQQLGDLVPYANGMKFIHHHQAAVTGDLLSRRLEKAIQGHQKSRQVLEGYGVDPKQWQALKAQYDQHGMLVDNWDDAAWDAVRSPLYRAMDEAVLQARLGDLPTFVAFDPVGKALFQYRNFVVTAHNKLLAGTLERHGAGALGLMYLYQFPLALAATQAQTALMGKEDDKPLQTAVAQMGALGLLSEPFKWMTGQSNSVGAPVLIPFDRGVKVLQSVRPGQRDGIDPGVSASLLGDMVPVYAAQPVLKAIGARARE